jgi:hypothetical protein
MKIVYLLIDGRPLIPYKDKWRVFTDKAVCMEEARKLGYGGSVFGNMFNLSDEPGRAVTESGAGVDITMVPIIVDAPTC